MIDEDVFADAWARLCRRFGRKVDADELGDYFAYLNASGLTTAQFVAAAEAAWATREFFPRPADFLAGEGLVGWKALQELATTNQFETDKIKAAWAKVPKRALLAINAIGGTDAIRNANDLIRVRREYLSAYEAQVQEEAMGLERIHTEQQTPAYLRTSGGRPQRIIAALPPGSSEGVA